MQKSFIPLDVYERHKFIAGQITAGTKIIDVGGSLTQLAKFVKANITTVDVKAPADIIYNGKKVPVKDKSYHVATAIDVLEHLPKNARKDFIKELIRTAEEQVIISAPYGTPAHISYEKQALKKHEIVFLEEHIKLGLPTPEDVETLAKEFNGQLFFGGDIRLTKILFDLHNFEFKNKYLNHLFYYLKLLTNFLANNCLYPFLISAKSHAYTNRFYLIIKSPNV